MGDLNGVDVVVVVVVVVTVEGVWVSISSEDSVGSSVVEVGSVDGEIPGDKLSVDSEGFHSSGPFEFLES